MIYWFHTFRRYLISEAFEDYSYDFLDSYGNEPLLSAEDEQKLISSIREGEKAEDALNNQKNLKNKKELEFIQRRGKRAKERFIRANIRLSMHVARNYTGRGLPFGDLVQEGIFGISHAIRKFEPERGYRFSTYATPWIRQYISRAVINTGATIRVPEHRINEMHKVNKIKNGLFETLGREPSLEELAEATGKSLEILAALDGYSQQPVSLHVTVGEDSNELGDILVNDQQQSPEDAYEESYLADQIRKVFKGLTEREAELMTLRHGLGVVGVSCSLAAAAEEMGISRERARQLERTALSKLRHPKNQHLHQFLGSR